MINDELKQKLFDFGALKYPDKKIASVLQMEPSQLDELMKNGGRKIYESGTDAFEFAMDRKLMEMSLSGDLKAMQKIEQKRRR